MPYTTLMGATTHRLMSEFAEQGEEGVDTLTALDKVVFSSSLDVPLSWANTELVTGDAIEAVREMKRSKALRTLGSLSLSRHC